MIGNLVLNVSVWQASTPFPIYLHISCSSSDRVEDLSGEKCGTKLCCALKTEISRPSLFWQTENQSDSLQTCGYGPWSVGTPKVYLKYSLNVDKGSPSSYLQSASHYSSEWVKIFFQYTDKCYLPLSNSCSKTSDRRVCLQLWLEAVANQPSPSLSAAVIGG